MCVDGKIIYNTNVRSQISRIQTSFPRHPEVRIPCIIYSVCTVYVQWIYIVLEVTWEARQSLR